jgi:hypothetical protein
MPAPRPRTAVSPEQVRRAVTISAAVEDEDVQPGTTKAQYVIDIGGHVGSVISLQVGSIGGPAHGNPALPALPDQIDLHDHSRRPTETLI